MKTHLSKLIVMQIALLLLCTPLYAATRTVDDDAGADFTSIQDAIDASSAGDVVYVFPGTYNEQVTMKDEVNLLGYGPHVTTIDGQGTANNVVTFAGPNGAVISGFRITGSVPSGPWWYGGILCQSGPLTVRNNIIENNHAGVAVFSAANPNIINNTMVNNTNGVILEAREPLPPDPHQIIVIIIYDTDLPSAESFALLLEANDIVTSLVQMDQIVQTDFSECDAIIVGDDTGSFSQWGDPETVAVIAESGKPVLGVGDGGYAFFGKLQLETGYGNGAHTAWTSVLAVNQDHEVYKSPNLIGIPETGIVDLYSRDTAVTTFYFPEIPRNVVVFGQEIPVLKPNPWYTLTLENGRFFLWGFSGSPDGMTPTGKDLFINALRALLRKCYPDLPYPEIAPLGSEPFTINPDLRIYDIAVTNWTSFPEDLFEPAAYLPPCGLNTSSSRSWITVYAEDDTRLQSFCGLNRDSLKDILWASFPEEEDPPAVYIVIQDRRCDISYVSNIIQLTREKPVTHTIMNNIIVSNSNAGIFYYNYTTDGDILYNDVWDNYNNLSNYHNNVLGNTTFVPLPGTGEISADPLFVDTADYFLDEGSPCRDTGHPDALYFDPDGTRNDMGAYGGPDASGRGYHPGSGFIFTSIGNIPTSEIVQDPLEPTLGLADVDAATAADLHIPAYNDAPFGSTVRIHGLFGETDILDGVRFYQILLAPWDGPGDPPEPTDFAPMTTGLSKIKYTPQPDGTVLTQTVALGPQTISSISNLYELTYQGWWSHIDLRMIWNTRTVPNGLYRLTYKAYKYVSPGILAEHFPASNDLDTIDILVNNSPVEAIIHNVKYDPTSPNWSLATDGEIPECGIINLQNNTENLRLNITAKHPDGYLRHWVLDALWGKNNYAGVIASQTYPGTVPPDNWPGVTAQEYDTSAGSLTPWQPCAYQFRLRAYTRATNGYGYLYSTVYKYSDSFSDHYFIDLGTTCAWCGGADVNRDGTVNVIDLAIVAEHYLMPCGVSCP